MFFFPGKAKTRYDILVRTGVRNWAGTDARIFVKLYGQTGISDVLELSNEKFKFERGRYRDKF